MLRGMIVIGAILLGFILGYYFGFNNAWERAAQQGVQFTK
jgi:hypothetical protein